MALDDMKKSAPLMGLILGVVFLVGGFRYGNTGLLMMGGIMLALGLFLKYKK
jgi:hypothetical protein